MFSSLSLLPYKEMLLTWTNSPSPTKSQHRNSDEEKPTAIRPKPSGYISDATSRLAESESEGNKSDGKATKPSQETPTMQRPKIAPAARTSYPALSSAKSRQPEGTRNMTVETETVASVPQTSIGGLPMGMVNERGRLDGGSLRLKPSTETIRPRKDRKRTSRKTPSINNGTGAYHTSNFPLLQHRHKTINAFSSHVPHLNFIARC